LTGAMWMGFQALLNANLQNSAEIESATNQACSTFDGLGQWMRENEKTQTQIRENSPIF